MIAHCNEPTLTRAVGVGLKPAHYREALAGGHGIDFFEAHAENYFGEGGPPHRWLTALRERFPLSLHGVCLSVGGRDALDTDHLARLAELARRYEPALVSEHLAWSADGGIFFNDLLPPPMTEKALARTCDHVDRLQAALGRRVLIENPAVYIAHPGAGMSEPEFLNALARRTGCGLLLDINNIAVSAANTGADPEAWLDAIDPAPVGEIHLAGHLLEDFEGEAVRVDNHGGPASPSTLALYERFVSRAGARPTLFEWDTKPPAFAALRAEAARIRAAMNRAEGGYNAAA